ncbi:hypothetical protein BGZ61DRAFT_370158, partial [Ilyonectria robusta]|uniref:uncharacterized protein n=1 Tax=Ilyonectria robusta TaxID=1079257 RepID=UPI001E8D6850
RAIYYTLMQHLHPHIIPCVLDAPKGIFMHRLAMTLDDRLAKQILSGLKKRGGRQLSSTIPWLVHLSYVYGDLRLANNFLTWEEVVKSGHFDCAVKIGERLVVLTVLFGKLYSR